jgi:hypothetical protein
MIPWELGAEADRSRLDFEKEEKEEYNAETLRPQRYRREARGEANRAGWRLTIKGYGSTDVMQLSSTY